MRITEKLMVKDQLISFEVFPPKTDSAFESVRTATEEIAKLRPSFMSVTYGAGGGTSKYTLDIAKRIKEQYDVLYGHWPEKHDEVVLVVDKNNEVSDLVLYALGLKSNSSMAEDMQAFMDMEDLKTEVESWSYEEICSMNFRYIYPADEYRYDEEIEEYVSMTEEELGMRNLFNNGLNIKIVGIIRQNESAISGMMTGSIGYTHALVEYVVRQAETKELVKRQLEDTEHDVFNGLQFLGDDESLTSNRKRDAAIDYIVRNNKYNTVDITYINSSNAYGTILVDLIFDGEYEWLVEITNTKIFLNMKYYEEEYYEETEED